MVQRDFLWPRHSHAFVIQNPTWPVWCWWHLQREIQICQMIILAQVEWQQLSAFLGWQDYMATGTPDLALAFMNIMYVILHPGSI